MIDKDKQFIEDLNKLTSEFSATKNSRRSTTINLGEATISLLESFDDKEHMFFSRLLLLASTQKTHKGLSNQVIKLTKRLIGIHSRSYPELLSRFEDLKVIKATGKPYMYYLNPIVIDNGLTLENKLELGMITQSQFEFIQKLR